MILFLTAAAYIDLHTVQINKLDANIILVRRALIHKQGIEAHVPLNQLELVQEVQAAEELPCNHLDRALAKWARSLHRRHTLLEVVQQISIADSLGD